jgi:hypothetical protein
MDPLTASLHVCAHRFIPYVKDNQCATTIRYGDSYYTIVIQKQPVQVSYTPPSVVEMLKQMEQKSIVQDAKSIVQDAKSILGKRPHEENIILCDRIACDRTTYQRTGYDLTDNTLYPSLGHGFE